MWWVMPTLGAYVCVASGGERRTSRGGGGDDSAEAADETGDAAGATALREGDIVFVEAFRGGIRPNVESVGGS